MVKGDFTLTNDLKWRSLSQQLEFKYSFGQCNCFKFAQSERTFREPMKIKTWSAVQTRMTLQLKYLLWILGPHGVIFPPFRIKHSLWPKPCKYLLSRYGQSDIKKKVKELTFLTYKSRKSHSLLWKSSICSLHAFDMQKN